MERRLSIRPLPLLTLSDFVPPPDPEYLRFINSYNPFIRLIQNSVVVEHIAEHLRPIDLKAVSLISKDCHNCFINTISFYNELIAKHPEYETYEDWMFPQNDKKRCLCLMTYHEKVEKFPEHDFWRSERDRLKHIREIPIFYYKVDPWDSDYWRDSDYWEDSNYWGDSDYWGDSEYWGDSNYRGDSDYWRDSNYWGDSDSDLDLDDFDKSEELLWNCRFCALSLLFCYGLKFKTRKYRRLKFRKCNQTNKVVHEIKPE